MQYTIVGLTYTPTGFLLEFDVDVMHRCSLSKDENRFGIPIDSDFLPVRHNECEDIISVTRKCLQDRGTHPRTPLVGKRAHLEDGLGLLARGIVGAHNDDERLSLPGPSELQILVSGNDTPACRRSHRKRGFS